MQLNPEDPRVRWATFGRQVEQFLESDIGAYLVKRAKDEIAAGIEQLKKVDAFAPNEILRAQNLVNRAESVMGWLGDAVIEGQSAVEQLRGEE